MTDHDAPTTVLDLDVGRQPLAVCRLPAMADVPPWVAGDLVSVTRTAEEVSIVCAADAVPIGTVVEGPFRALTVRGPLDVTLVGVLLGLLGPLAAAEVPVFVVSTYDTDVLLVPDDRVAAAGAALTDAGHRVHRP